MSEKINGLLEDVKSTAALIVDQTEPEQLVHKAAVKIILDVEALVYLFDQVSAAAKESAKAIEEFTEEEKEVVEDSPELVEEEEQAEAEVEVPVEVKAPKKTRKEKQE